MARPSLEEIRNIKDFATTYRWDLYLPPPQSIATFEDINFRCESIEVPVKQAQLIDLTMRGFKTSVNGIWNNSQDLTLSLVETIDSKISNLIKEWTELCWNPKTSSASNSSVIKVDGYLDRLDSNDIPVWRYNLKGCMPSSYTFNTLDSSSEILRPSIVIRYDYFTENPI